MKRKRWIFILLVGGLAAVSAVLVTYQLELKQLEGFLYYTGIGDGSTAPQSYEFKFESRSKKAVMSEDYSRIDCVASTDNGFVYAAVSQNGERFIVSDNNGVLKRLPIHIPFDLNSPLNAIAASGNELICQLQDGSLYQIDCETGNPSFLINGCVRGILTSIGTGFLFEQSIDYTRWISIYQNGGTEALCPGIMPLVLSDGAFLYYSQESETVLEYHLNSKTSVSTGLAYVPERYTSFDEFRPPAVKDGWIIGCEKTFRYDTPIPGAKFKLVATNLKTGRRLTIPGFSGERIYNLSWTDRQAVM